MKITFLLSIVFFSGLWFSCNKDKETNPEESGFSRKEMLAFYAEEQILPAIRNLNAENQILKEKVNQFLANPDSVKLKALQAQWETSYGVWLQANAFNFGPAGEAGTEKSLWEEIGVFPASKSKIDNILTTGSFNVNDFNRDARGFAAIEYLLFDPNQNTQAVLEKFQNVNARNYLLKLVEHLSGLVANVLQTWEGTYKAEFLNNNGTEVGSSTAMLYNEFVKSFEQIKNLKLGLPMGKRPGQTGSQPELAEAYYSGKSLKFIQLHFDAIEKIWIGKSFSSSAEEQGFKKYLMNVEGGPALVGSTEMQIQKVKEAIQKIPADKAFSEMVTANQAELENLHTEMQKLTRFFKSDMSSVLGIAITYSSGDGD
jgi:predicted lipoprotein